MDLRPYILNHCMVFGSVGPIFPFCKNKNYKINNFFKLILIGSFFVKNIQFNADYLYSIFYDTIVAKQLYRKLSFYNRFIYCRNLIYLTYNNIWLILSEGWLPPRSSEGLASSLFRCLVISDNLRICLSEQIFNDHSLYTPPPHTHTHLYYIMDVRG